MHFIECVDSGDGADANANKLQKGVAYETKSVATGLGAMLLNQLIETDVRAREAKMSRDEALNLLRKSIELSVYHDCVADFEFNLSVGGLRNRIASRRKTTVPL